jgi:hypothetical protein
MTNLLPRVQRTRYLLQGPQGYLVDLWEGKRTWSMMPVDAMDAGNTWTNLDHALLKLQQLLPTMPDLFVAEVTFEQVTPGNPHTWRAISTRAIGKES